MKVHERIEKAKSKHNWKEIEFYWSLSEVWSLLELSNMAKDVFFWDFFLKSPFKKHIPNGPEELGSVFFSYRSTSEKLVY